MYFILTSKRGTKQDCICNAGFTLKTDVCAKCELGYYKAARGNDACDECGANKYGKRFPTLFLSPAQS